MTAQLKFRDGFWQGVPRSNGSSRNADLHRRRKAPSRSARDRVPQVRLPAPGDGRQMSQSQANRQVAIMEAIAADYAKLMEGERLL